MYYTLRFYTIAISTTLIGITYHVQPKIEVNIRGRRNGLTTEITGSRYRRCHPFAKVTDQPAKTVCW